jgi:hypothetical protein
MFPDAAAFYAVQPLSDFDVDGGGDSASVCGSASEDEVYGDGLSSDEGLSGDEWMAEW